MTALESQLLFARALLLVLLYSFVGAVGLLALRDLRRAAQRRTDAQAPLGARLVMLDGSASDWPAGTVFALDDVSVIGRDLDAGLVLQDPTLSGRHATLTHHDGGWWLEDLGSTNGTFLNGEGLPPETPALVRSGDVVQFGAVRLRLVLPGLSAL